MKNLILFSVGDCTTPILHLDIPQFYCTVTSDIKKQDICIKRFTVSIHSCTMPKLFPPSMTFKILELSGERKQL